LGISSRPPCRRRAQPKAKLAKGAIRRPRSRTGLPATLFAAFQDSTASEVYPCSIPRRFPYKTPNPCVLTPPSLPFDPSLPNQRPGRRNPEQN
jgi:hypothetical protein